MSHVGRQLQAQFMARLRGRDPQRCLVVPIDVGKSTAAALIADHNGEVVVEPFDFALTEAGFTRLKTAIARAEASRVAEVVRVGVESAAHYHRTLVARLGTGGFEVVELNPRAVKESPSLQLLARLKSDARDLGAMAELMVRGAGRPPAVRTGSGVRTGGGDHRRRVGKVCSLLMAELNERHRRLLFGALAQGAGIDNPLGVGGRGFHFVDDGIERALERAFNAADGDDVTVGGGAATVQQYLRGSARRNHVVIVPILLGSGDRSSTTSGG